MSETSSSDGKIIGIVSYLSLIGWIIALVMHNNEKTEFGAYHIRQSLGLMILYICVWLLNIILAIVNIPFLGYILFIAVFILWILALVGAIQGEKKPVPLLGEQFQQWFKGIG